MRAGNLLSIDGRGYSFKFCNGGSSNCYHRIRRIEVHMHVVRRLQLGDAVGAGLRSTPAGATGTTGGTTGGTLGSMCSAQGAGCSSGTYQFLHLAHRDERLRLQDQRWKGLRV